MTRKARAGDYIRDTRSPVSSSARASHVMSRNRAKDTSPELTLRRALWASGMRGYRLHPRGIPGRPDVAFIGRRLAIFVNGCFWHHCPVCDLPIPESNRDFWQAKFDRNQARDARKLRELQEAGWRTVVVWEHEIRDDLPGVLRRIRRIQARSAS